MPKPTHRVLLEDRLSYRCLAIGTRITRIMAPMWEDRHGLTVITWRVMAVIGRFGPLSAKDVAAHTTTDAFFVSRAIEQLVARNFVHRDIDPQDRRRLYLELTARGKSVHRKIEAAINRVEAELVSGLSSAERNGIEAVLAYLDRQTSELLESGKTWKDFTGNAARSS